MAEQLKFIYNQTYISKLSEAIQQHDAGFQQEVFIQSVFTPEWDNMELKQRMRHITLCLKQALPDEYDQAIQILQNSISSLAGYGLENLIFPDFVEQFGLANWGVSLPALQLFTTFSTSEFAVRPFIMQDSERMMSQMESWALHDNEHVRRLASEGCRPRLPWAVALPEFKRDPAPIIPILDKLKSDPSEYVRKSVANNMNDITKDHPELVIELAQRWHGKHPHTDWIIKHGCRTLLKKGNAQALQLFGFYQDLHMKIDDLKLSKNILEIGDSFIFSFELKTVQSAHKLRLEYGVDYVKANGTLSRKIFQITEKQFAPNHTILISRSHSFAERTTRKHYKGIHRITIIANGMEQAFAEFELC